MATVPKLHTEVLWDTPEEPPGGCGGIFSLQRKHSNICQTLSKVLIQVSHYFNCKFCYIPSDEISL